MRLSLSVNGVLRVTAAVNGPGYLNVHLNLHDRPKESDYSKIVRVEGTQTQETETVSLHWPQSELRLGDVLEIRLLDDGEADAPTTVKRSSESPRNLFSHAELANELVGVVSDFDSRLMELLSKSEQLESADEHKTFKTAVGRVLYATGENFLYPVYRRHKELIPDELKGELL